MKSFRNQPSFQKRVISSMEVVSIYVFVSSSCISSQISKFIQDKLWTIYLTHYWAMDILVELPTWPDVIGTLASMDKVKPIDQKSNFFHPELEICQSGVDKTQNQK